MVVGNGKNLYIGKYNGVDCLYGSIKFHELTQFGKDIALLAENNVIVAVSVGFIPIEMKQIPITEDMRLVDEYYGNTMMTIFTKWELIEFSLCDVPANSYALVNHAKEYSKQFNDILNKYKENNMTEIEKSGARISSDTKDEMIKMRDDCKSIHKIHKEAMKHAKNIHAALTDMIGDEDSITCPRSDGYDLTPNTPAPGKDDSKDDSIKDDSKDDSKSKGLSELEMDGLLYRLEQKMKASK